MVASLFTGGDRDKLALAWSRSWGRAQTGARGTVTLAEDTGDPEALGSLFEQASATTAIPRRPKKRATQPTPATDRGHSERLPARHLKRVETSIDKTVEIVQSDGYHRRTGGHKRGLRANAGPGRRINGSRTAPISAPLAYSPEERGGTRPAGLTSRHRRRYDRSPRLPTPSWCGRGRPRQASPVL